MDRNMKLKTMKDKMELRWVKGNWEFGRFKLQMLIDKEEEGFTWVDVPIAEEFKSEHEHEWTTSCHCGVTTAPFKDKPKELWEKFQTHGEENGWFKPLMSPMNNSFRFCKSLADIAKKHYGKSYEE